MNDLAKIKAVLQPLQQSVEGKQLDLSSLEQACSIWRTAAEAEKFEAELQNAHRAARSEAMRFWSATLAPVATFVILGATLVFQIFQFGKTAEASHAAEEEKQWRDTLKTLSDPETLSGMGGFVQLESFFKSPRYRAPAREYAVHLLGARGAVMIIDGFEMLFPSVMETTTWDTHQDVINMLGRMGESWSGLNDKVKELKEKENKRTTGSFPGGVGATRSGPPPFPPNTSPGGPVVEDSAYLERQQDMLSKEIAVVGAAFVKFLKTHRPPNAPLNLANAPMWETDFSGMDFGPASCPETWFWYCNFKNADLTRLINFDQSAWLRTPWWRVKRLNRPLLDYLKKEYPFNSDWEYPAEPTATQEEFEAQLARLEKETN